jgi:hypothetical protein
MTPARLCADRRRRNQRQGRPGEALEAARARSAEGVTIQAIGVAHAIRRFVAELGSDVAVRGLCDENEEPLFRRVLDDVYVCVPDLEGELIRALGVERMLQIVDRDSFETMQRQPAQRTVRSSCNCTAGYARSRPATTSICRYSSTRSSPTASPRRSRACSESERNCNYPRAPDRRPRRSRAARATPHVSGAAARVKSRSTEV